MFRWLDFKITNRCNRRCTYCGVSHDTPSSPEILGVDVVQAALGDALRLGFAHFALLGGEPSLRHNIADVFEPFRGQIRARSLIVITNGVVFNEALYRGLFSTNAEAATLVFSLDSLRAPNYKSQNPETSLDHLRAIQAVAREYDGVNGRREVSVHAVISRENLWDVESHVETLLNLGIDVSLALVCPACFLDTETAKAFNEFSHAELGGILRQLESLDRRGRLNFANRTLLSYLRADGYGKMRLSGSCRAGRQVVIINSDGEVYPCIPESYGGGGSFGNISREHFSAIFPRMASFKCRSSVSQACWDHFMWDNLAANHEDPVGDAGTVMSGRAGGS